MSKLLLSHVNDLDAGTVTASSQHPSFPAVNVQQRWFTKTWRSKYGAGSSWGMFRITTANQNIYFNEGGANLTCSLTVGDYDATTILAEIKAKMDAAGATYTPIYNETLMRFYISITAGTFKLLLSNQTNAIWNTLGFTGTVDTALAVGFWNDGIRIHTSAFLYVNLGSTKTIKFLALKGHNLQSTAVITAHYYSDAFITPVAADVMAWHAGTIAKRVSRAYQYVAYEISDPSNPNGYIEVGRAWVGDELVLHYGYNPEHEFAPQDPSVISSSDDGQESTIQKTHFAEWNYVFDAVTPADRVSLAALFLAIGFSMPCFSVEAPPVSGDLGLLARYAKFTEWNEPHLAGAYWSMEVAMRSER